MQVGRAKQLLSETGHPIHRIAQLVGFEYPEYFNVFFKREVGLSPGEFRRNTRRGSVCRGPLIGRRRNGGAGKVGSAGEIGRNQVRTEWHSDFHKSL